ncbi:MAG: ABC-2 family transporter protein [Ardenticatenaceae bacterium]|nr:ABC-2 family transporter protein [Ardenticatenaceae bacterium]MCB9445651.1 ABC-2 family transporter protein [Ardenticatenaceae bacterium]
MNRLKNELNFLKTLAGINLASAMEYRASFLSQIFGMMINNGIYFVFWLIFFDRFGTIRGYNIDEIYLLFAIVTFGYGIAYMFAGNTSGNLAYLIAQGRLDYYLVFPRNVLLHVVFSRMVVSALGDLTFGVVAYLFTGRFQPIEILLFLLLSVLVALVLIAFAILAGSLAFFMGNSQQASHQLNMTLLTFALYPNSLFSGAARFMLYTIIPAAFIGSVPVQIIQERNGLLLLGLAGAALVLWGVATAVFYTGLRRYESGSAINVNV